MKPVAFQAHRDRSSVTGSSKRDPWMRKGPCQFTYSTNGAKFVQHELGRYSFFSWTVLRRDEGPLGHRPPKCICMYGKRSKAREKKKTQLAASPTPTPQPDSFYPLLPNHFSNLFPTSN